MKEIWTRFKNKYHIENNFQVALMLLIFSIAGSSILVVKKPLFHLIHYSDIPYLIVRIIVYIIFIIPTYYLFLFLWANLLGQGKIFNPLIKKMLGRWLSIFQIKKKT